MPSKPTAEQLAIEQLAMLVAGQLPILPADTAHYQIYSVSENPGYWIRTLAVEVRRLRCIVNELEAEIGKQNALIGGLSTSNTTVTIQTNPKE